MNTVDMAEMVVNDIGGPYQPVAIELARAVIFADKIMKMEESEDPAFWGGSPPYKWLVTHSRLSDEK